MYPLTLHTPKPLLDIAGRSIIDRLLDKLERTPGIDECIVVSNDKFFDRFLAWSQKAVYSWPLVILNDGSTDNENRLGAVADIRFAIWERHISDDLLVLAGDNLFDFELAGFTEFFHAKNCDCITTHKLEDTEQLRRTGVIEADKDWNVISFEEKPARPRSSLAVPPFYVYKKETLPLFTDYIEEGQNPDAPGNFIPWLLGRKPVAAYFFEGRRYDIGCLETYKTVCGIFDKEAFPG